MTQKKKESMKDNLRWTPEMDECFIDALLEETMKGNRPDGTFSTYAYDNMVQTLTNNFGTHITKQHLKNRKKTLSQRFAELYDLFHGLSGFSWSPITKLFEADNQVWHDLIERKPNARKWKNAPVLHYDKLYELFSADRATGKYSKSGKERVAQWNSNVGGTNVESECNFQYESPNSQANLDDSPSNGTSVGTASVRGQKRKASMIESIEERCEKMTAGIKELVDVMRDGNVVAERQAQLAEKQAQLAEKHAQVAEWQAQIAEKQAQIAEKGLSILEKSRPRHYSEGEVWTAIEEIGIPEEQKLECYFFLCNEERHKLNCFGVPPHLRLQTLLRLMTDARNH
ncbi:uncharacterized protein LOC114716406 [Neltuma alba]|uniref:uncharacterized protein LOC114716406 n=1 Tax=Neltuma alba TaxID=207710 RepID=UPI0010A3BC7F|nr:uncharacterized protein LOC114716406 [Prosopis alba]